jgi:hypothetical protein
VNLGLQVCYNVLTFDVFDSRSFEIFLSLSKHDESPSDVIVQAHNPMTRDVLYVKMSYRRPAVYKLRVRSIASP